MRKSISKTKQLPTQKKENGHSNFSLFGAKAAFTDEPIWYKLTVIMIIVITVFVQGLILKHWILPIIGQSVLRSSVIQMIDSIKSRDP
jgi:hypothetical protein